MAIPRRAAELVDLVGESLRRQPWQTLSAIALELGASRDTLERALRAHGTGFRALRRVAVADALARQSATTPALSGKELAVRLGFGSPSAFAHFRSRVESGGSAHALARRAKSPCGG